MVTKQKHFLDSIRQMVSKSPDELCPHCKGSHEGDSCPEPNKSEHTKNLSASGTAYLVDLVSNHKIRIPVPLCQVGRDETNDIVVSGDQSISRHHLHLIHEGGQYYLEDNGSRHGTFLNGTQINTRELINDGDVIKIGVSLFWFVVEEASNESGNTNGSEPGSQFTNTANQGPGEPAHLKVGSDIQTEPSDPASSTMNEIPVMPSEQTLLERLKHKTRSFDQPGFFNNAQSQMSTMAPPGSNKNFSDTQSTIPAMNVDSFLNEKANDNIPASFEDPYQPATSPAQELNMAPQSLNAGSALYHKLMDADLAELTDKYQKLQEQIEHTEKEKQVIADQLNNIQELGISLIEGNEQQLVESCYKIFSKLGWQIARNPNDSHELHMKTGEHLSIARIICTADEPARAHLGQLSISQTQQWCDQGQEPKGILVINRLSKNGESPTLTKVDYESELASYAAKKNVCMMTSMQVLAIYQDLIIRHTDINLLRDKIINGAGWLEGFAIKTA